jgi:hypothetical protein
MGWNVPDPHDLRPDRPLKGTADESHTHQACLIALVKFLARRAAESDFKKRRHEQDNIQ